MWDLTLMTLFINHPPYMGFFSYLPNMGPGCYSPSLQLQRCGSSFAPVSVSTKLAASSTAVGFVKVFRSDLFRSPFLRWIQPPTCSFTNLIGRPLISPSSSRRPAPSRPPPKSPIFGLFCCFIYCFCLYFW
jgi:hypothetical protein